jgi:NADH:ubiquinone oxidoreductase subunit 2 (subunit N)
MPLLTPPLLDTRPEREQILRATVPAAIFGIIVGIAADKSSGVYIVLALLAVAGCVLAGFEHRDAGDAALRGFGMGAAFGIGVLFGHAFFSGGGSVLPHPAGWEPIITAIVSVPLCALGGELRARREPPA